MVLCHHTVSLNTAILKLPQMVLNSSNSVVVVGDTVHMTLFLKA